MESFVRPCLHRHLHLRRRVLHDALLPPLLILLVLLVLVILISVQPCARALKHFLFHFSFSSAQLEHLCEL